MASRRLFVLGLALGTAAGCAAGEADGPIDYEVTGGLTGAGDGTDALHIELDGTMTLRSQGGETRTAQLDDARLDDLLVKIERARFDELEPAYGGAAADDFVHEVSVQVDGRSYAVAAAEHADKPERLEVVIDALHDLAQSAFR